MWPLRQICCFWLCFELHILSIAECHSVPKNLPVGTTQFAIGGKKSTKTKQRGRYWLMHWKWLKISDPPSNIFNAPHTHTITLPSRLIYYFLLLCGLTTWSVSWSIKGRKKVLSLLLMVGVTLSSCWTVTHLSGMCMRFFSCSAFIYF